MIVNQVEGVVVLDGNCVIGFVTNWHAYCVGFQCKIAKIVVFLY